MNLVIDQALNDLKWTIEKKKLTERQVFITLNKIQRLAEYIEDEFD